MTQAELNRAVAKVTGESFRTVANRGSVPLTSYPVERQPLTVDWDELDAKRTSPFPQRQSQTSAA